MIELADVFHRYEERYSNKNKLPWNIVKAINAIKNCRTESMGGHIYRCEECNEEFKLYNSCRNRHCPKCQGISFLRFQVDFLYLMFYSDSHEYILL